MKASLRYLHPHVLLVEDNPGDARLTEVAFLNINREVHLHVANNGLEAVAFLRHDVAASTHTPRPDLILLDLNMPKMGGFEVLTFIKMDDRLKRIPTVILTTSEAVEDIRKSYQLQANSYLTKPVQFPAFESLIGSINDFWLTRAMLPDQDQDN